MQLFVARKNHSQYKEESNDSNTVVYVTINSCLYTEVLA